ncbi:DUF3122 domain-containing protein [Synechococcus sp. RSCCF101]|uniref:DUF3122 domain-containing protein n=1 Tax=Synechococcus sp. RSCCF101 TaxID=2511069 RepID=UPI00124827C3|nr:DUF3122 domain-containing protein [Synechococcus sp. RSCCF101]QEY31446.1 DUF3122 domain-containing protein [Synechococcus sp. RSCCF101]
MRCSLPSLVWARHWLCELRCWLVGLIAALWLVAGPAAAVAEADSGPFSVQDSHGSSYQLRIFRQPDPDHAGGWRLRLTNLDPQAAVSHSLPLEIRESPTRRWSLANVSSELVPQGETVLPPQSAQFDLGELEPRPAGFLPLQARLAPASGSDEPMASLLLGAEPAALLHELPES